jgi:hypothetical protein
VAAAVWRPAPCLPEVGDILYRIRPRAGSQAGTTGTAVAEPRDWRGRRDGLLWRSTKARCRPPSPRCVRSMTYGSRGLRHESSQSWRADVASPAGPEASTRGGALRECGAGRAGDVRAASVGCVGLMPRSGTPSTRGAGRCSSDATARFAVPGQLQGTPDLTGSSPGLSFTYLGHPAARVTVSCRSCRGLRVGCHTKTLQKTHLTQRRRRFSRRAKLLISSMSFQVESKMLFSRYGIGGTAPQLLAEIRRIRPTRISRRLLRRP